MSIEVEDLLDASPEAEAPVDYRRNGNGWPLIVPETGGKAVAYRRSSGYGKVLGDTFTLDRWQRRNVAYGMARDPSLVARLLAIGGTPHEWTNAEKEAANDVVEAANGVAQAHRGADIGTAVHKFTERHDLGDPVPAGLWSADVDAYAALLDAWGIEVDPAYVECRLVCDALEVAGTADRLVGLSASSPLRFMLDGIGDDDLLVGDLKTGSIAYGGLDFACQLAAYAHGTLYNVETDRREWTPPVNRRHGLVFHVPAGEGRAQLVVVDLVAGYAACELARDVYEARRASRGWLTPLDTPRRPAPPTVAHRSAPADTGLDPVVAEAAAALRVRLGAAVAAGVTRVDWPAHVTKFRDGGPSDWAEVLDVERAVMAAETEAGLPFEAKLPLDPYGPLRPSLPLLDYEAVERPARPSQAHLGRLRLAHDRLPEPLQTAAADMVRAAGVSTDRRRWFQLDADLVEGILAAAHRALDHLGDPAIAAAVLRHADDGEGALGDLVDDVLAGLDDGTVGAVVDDEGRALLVFSNADQ